MFSILTVDDLEVIDADAYARLDLCAKLLERLRKDQVRFSLVEEERKIARWPHTALLNHSLFFPGGPSEILH